MTDRIVIGGGPRTGKTTLAAELGFHDLPHVRSMRGCYAALSHERAPQPPPAVDWGDVPGHVADWIDSPGPWIIEGVHTIRGLRYALRVAPHQRPCDLLIWRRVPLAPLKPGQDRMRKMLEAILAEIAPSLRLLGVRMEVR